MTSAERAVVGEDLLRRYESGRSIREICKETGYSIGRVRRLLEDAGVTYRRRGGAHRPRTPDPVAQEPVAE
jgi:hypothetical protein